MTTKKAEKRFLPSRSSAVGLQREPWWSGPPAACQAAGAMLVVLTMLILCARSTAASPPIITFEKIAVVGETIPARNSKVFNSFDWPSLARGKIVVFHARDKSNADGIYAYLGGRVLLVADTQTNVAGGGGTFLGFGTAPAVFGSTVFFIADGPTTQDHGIYAADLSATPTPAIALVAGRSVTTPDGSGKFLSFYNLSAPSGILAFSASTEASLSAIYTKDYTGSQPGPLVFVANETKPLLGTGTFRNLEAPQADGTQVAFRSYWSDQGTLRPGIFVIRDGVAAVIAKRGDTIPDDTRGFDSFSWPAARGGAVALWGDSANDVHEGIYLDGSNSSLKTVVDNTTSFPGRAGDSFVYFGSTYSLDDYPTDLVFSAQTKLTFPGIYARVRGSLIKIIAAGDKLPPNGSVPFVAPYWRAATSFTTDDAWKAEKCIAFVASTSPSSGASSGIYLATVITGTPLTIGGITNSDSGIANGLVQEPLGHLYDGYRVVNDEPGFATWTITGAGFGTTVGVVTLNGQTVPPTTTNGKPNWSDTSIGINPSGIQINAADHWNWPSPVTAAPVSTKLIIRTANGQTFSTDVQVVPAIKTRVYGQCPWWVAFRRKEMHLTLSPSAYGGYTAISGAWQPHVGEQLAFIWTKNGTQFKHQAIIETVGPAVTVGQTTTYALTISQYNANVDNQKTTFDTTFSVKRANGSNTVTALPKFSTSSVGASIFYPAVAAQ